MARPEDTRYGTEMREGRKWAGNVSINNRIITFRERFISKFSFKRKKKKLLHRKSSIFLEIPQSLPIWCDKIVTYRQGWGFGKYINFMFWRAGCSLSRAEGFSCSLGVLSPPPLPGVLYGGLGISKLRYLWSKKYKFFSCCKMFSIFRSSKP